MKTCSVFLIIKEMRIKIAMWEKNIKKNSQYVRQQKRHRCIEQYLDSVGEGEVG